MFNRPSATETAEGLLIDIRYGNREFIKANP